MDAAEHRAQMDAYPKGPPTALERALAEPRRLNEEEKKGNRIQFLGFAVTVAGLFAATKMGYGGGKDGSSTVIMLSALPGILVVCYGYIVENNGKG